MRLTVKGYRGIDRADVQIPDTEITIFAGPNGTGKSSLLEGLRYNIKSDGNPLGLHKKDIEVLIHDGCKNAEISVETDLGVRKLLLPSCEIKTVSGRGINATDIALGMKKLGSLSPSELSEILAKRLECGLDRKRLDVELKELSVLDPPVYLREDMRNILVDAVFGTPTIAPKGWEGAETIADSNSITFKRQFEKETGVGWGAAKGYNFLPKGWEPDLTKVNFETLVQNVTLAREARERVVALNAVSEAESEALKIQAEKKEEAIAALKKAEEEERHNALLVEAASSELAAAKASESLVECSECGNTGHVVEGVLMPAEETVLGLSSALIEEEAKARKQSLAEASRVVAAAKVAVITAESAAAKLANSTIAETNPLDAADQELARAQIRLEAFGVKKKGTEAHCQRMLLMKAGELLGSEGLRLRVLIQAIPAFNKQLQEICTIAGWAVVSIGADLMVRYGGRPYVAISESEQYRADATMQLAIAKWYENAPVVLFDRADVLDRDGINQLIRALTSLKVTAVVGMTFKSVMVNGKLVEAKDAVPRLKPGHGVTYWLSESTAEKLEPIGVPA